MKYEFRLNDIYKFNFYVTADTLLLHYKHKPLSFKYNQQNAALYNILYYCQCSTCFGRFLRTSSGAQELYTQHLVCARLARCYRSVAASKPGTYQMLCTVLEVLMMGGETPSSEQAWHIPDAVCTVLEVLMMGRETTRNM